MTINKPPESYPLPRFRDIKRYFVIDADIRSLFIGKAFHPMAILSAIDT